MNEAWAEGLTRFHSTSAACGWDQREEWFRFNDFQIETKASYLVAEEVAAQIKSCIVPQPAFDSLENNVRAFFADAKTVDEQKDRWGAATQAIEIIRESLKQNRREAPPSFERIRFLVMAYPADVGAWPLSDGEHARDQTLHESLLHWLDLLDCYEDDKVFPDWDGARISEEYGYVTQRLAVQKTLRRPGRVAFESDVAEFASHHLLPRYDLARTWKLSNSLYRSWTWAATVLVGALLIAGPLLLWLGPGGPHARLGWAAHAGGLALALLVLAAVRAAPVVAYPYCLRLPAGAAVGMVAVLSTDRILKVTPAWWQVLTPIAVLFGYIAFEARQHSANRPELRALVVAALGLLYGIAVASLTLSIVNPSFPVPGSPNDWGWGTGLNMLLIVAFRGAVAVLTGTLLQVLWSERTVASPLDRMTWRKS
jgi:hypothetical protein